MSQSRVTTWLLAACVALFVFLALPWHGAAARTQAKSDDGQASAQDKSDGTPLALDASVASPASAAQPLLGAMVYDTSLRRYVASVGHGRAVLSISPRLQQGLEKLLAAQRVPVGAVVLIEPRTGRVRALAEHVEKGPKSHVALQAIAPAASIFKIVTTAALLERGIAPDSEVCFHGGRHGIQKALLADNPLRDHRCLTLASALGKSANVVFAKLAGRDLSAELLRVEADRFLFNATIPFAWPVEPSPAPIPDDPFELAKTAAGFGSVRLSPLHGALMAATVANGGVLVPPRVVDEVDGVAAPPPGEARTVIRPEVAAALARMLRTTVTEGTARKVFRGAPLARRSPLGEPTAAGKTGSLFERDPFRDYSWFVGFAPVDDPQIAVAAVVVNERIWRVKASFVAHQALKAYFSEEDVSSRELRAEAR
ncbi:MAG: penicillin-binding protein [Anaeromyxobacter sp. RBG_16_69_14]|nr:MAG: penicillin-binding protein [Anaeromyxobacter sp. RBG_16_69_14]